MKTILCVFIFLLSSIGMCSGKLSVNPSMSFQTKEVLLAGGLSIYEQVPFLPVAYASFTGVGERLSDNMLSHIGYVSSIHDLDVSLGSRLTVGAGLTMLYEHTQDTFRNDVHVKLAYQLW